VPLSRQELERLSAEVSTARGEDVELLTEGSEEEEELAEQESGSKRHRAAKRFWYETATFAAIGSGGIIDAMLTKPSGTLHEIALGIGTGALMTAGGKVVARFWSRWERRGNE
jgi:hypothetical protein